MKTFGGTTPQERALSTLIHDHAGAISVAGSYFFLLEKSINNPDIPEYIRQNLYEYITKGKTGIAKINTVLDSYITKAQNDFN